MYDFSGADIQFLDPPATQAEIDMTDRALRSSHISVPERAALPKGKIRRSIAMHVVADALKKDGFFPARTSDCFIEWGKDKPCIVHSIIDAETTRSKPEDIQVDFGREMYFGIRAYLLVRDQALFGLGMDGLGIDWHA